MGNREGAGWRVSALAVLYEAKNPNIAPFIGRGGKLLLWHGFDDPGPGALRNHRVL
jgi:hypothetical protein